MANTQRIIVNTLRTKDLLSKDGPTYGCRTLAEGTLSIAVSHCAVYTFNTVSRPLIHIA